MIKTITKLLVILGITAILLPSKSIAAEKSLYSRLGGYDALAIVVDDLMQRLAADKQVGRVLEHIPETRANQVRQLMVQFLCQATGGPCFYIGKDMYTAHKGMGLTESDWNKTVKHLLATLAKFNVPEQEKNEVITAIAGLKSAIIES